MQGLEAAAAARAAMVTPEGLAALRQQALVHHHGMMAGFLGEHSSAAEGCRLALRWVAAQMLSFHVPDEMAELLVAAAYTGCVRCVGASVVVCRAW